MLLDFVFRPRLRRLFGGLLLGGLLVSAVPFSLYASDVEPTASFTISPNRGSLSSTFTFDASASVDQRGFSNTLEYRWNFDYSGGGEFSSWTSNAVATTQYTTAGDKTVLLEVRDEEGLTDRTSSTLEVSEEAIFEAWFDVSPTSGDTTTVFTFEAQISSNLSVPAEEYEVRWDFDGDGTYDTDYSSSHTTTHVYGDTSYFNPRLEVLSPDGTTLEVIGYDDDDEDDTSYILVTESGYPQAAINVYPSTGYPSTTFYFDASKSFDSEDYRDLDFRWDLNGDGTYELDWSSDTNPTTTYDLPGTYSASVQIRDSDGLTDEASVSVTILDDNLPPEAEFSISSDSGLTDKTIGTTSTTFTFNASGSSDEEDSTSALEVRWDYDGDGTWDTTYSTTKSAQHQYSDAGTYTVILEVIDTEGETDQFEDTVTVVSNDTPVATFTVSPSSGTPGTVFSFDASEVSDSQYKSSYLQVRWDWEGDGTYDTAFSSDKTTTHQYDEAGTYTVTLQVKDPESATSTATATVTVISSTAPTAVLTVDETEGTFSTLFHFDASASSDGETDSDDLKYRWDFNYTGENDILYDTSWSSTSTKSTYFDQTGDLQIRVEVKDEDDEVSSAIVTVNLHWASEYMDYLKSKGVLRGYSGGDLAPNQNITRAELLKMAMEAADWSISGHKYEGIFWDVDSTDWFDSYVEKGYGYGLIEGYSDGSFRPNQTITRAEAVTILIRAFDLEPERSGGAVFEDVPLTAWYSDYVSTAHSLGLISGHEDGLFHPDWNMTRGEASKVLALALQGDL